MKLEGVHHATCITGDAPANLAFYRDTLGLRLVKKTVNQDDPTVYHLLRRRPRQRGRGHHVLRVSGRRAGARGLGDGGPRRVPGRVGSLGFWEARVGGERSDGSLVFSDPEGLALELVVDESGEPPLVARSDAVPPEHALRGFASVRAYGTAPERSDAFLRGALGFEHAVFEAGYTARGDERSGFYVYDGRPRRRV